MNAFLLTAMAALMGEPNGADDESEILAKLAGHFDLTSTFWTHPGAAPEVTELPARREVVLDGRVLRMDVGSHEHGFQGTGLMGYDAAKRRFWYVWTDTTAAGFSTLHGSLSESGAGTLEGETPSPVGYVPLKVEIRTEGPIEIHDYFGPGEDGKTFRWMELRYRRR